MPPHGPKLVFVVTTDPARVDLGEDAYEDEQEAKAHARRLSRLTGRLHYAVPCILSHPVK